MDFSFANPISDLMKRKQVTDASGYGSFLDGAQQPAQNDGGGNWNGPLAATINGGDVTAALAQRRKQQSRGGGGMQGFLSTLSGL